MTTLHLVRCSAFETQDFSQCLELLTNDDALVLIDDGCYNLHHELINNIGQTIYIIKEHAQARAIKMNSHKTDLVIKPISMSALVQMTFSYKNSITWQ